MTARAAIAGNPSDGYDGAVLSMQVPAYAATVTVSEPSPGTERPETIAANLLDATHRRFSADVAAVGHLSLRVKTTIPRSVGLAGSSAIIIAAIRALAEHVAVELTDRTVAELTHTIERADLDIPGGWQDQIMQTNTTGRPLLMEFDEPMRHRVLSPCPTDVFVAWDASAEQSSAIPHRGLRSRAGELTTVMSELAELARVGADALESGNLLALGAAIDDTFALRGVITSVEPAHQHMIDVARSGGAHCNFAGSGGAISGLVPSDGQRFVEVVERAGLTLKTWRLEVPSEP